MRADTFDEGTPKWADRRMQRARSVFYNEKARTMAEWEMKELRELKIGRYVNIDDSPCKIISITTSKPGKHGSAKASIEATDIFTGAKKSLNAPVSAKVQVPIIDKRKGQVISIDEANNEIQIMDLETFETFTMPINEDHESVLTDGAEILYLVAMDRMKLM